MDVPSGFIPQWICYFQNIADISIAETLMSVGCLAVIILWGKVTHKIPGSLIALVVGTVASLLLSRFAGIELDKYPLCPVVCNFPSLNKACPLRTK